MSSIFSSIDFESDDSFYKFVGPNNSFYDLKYTPSGLCIIEGEHVHDVVHHILNEGEQRINKVVLDPLDQLANEFFIKFGMNLYVQSAFRDFHKQLKIHTLAPEEKKKFISYAGYSEHQTGYALDVINAQSDRNCYDEHFAWLLKNAYKFGFHHSYQKGVEIDGYPKENWHIRYLGKELSKYLNKKNLTYTEFYNIEKD